MYVVVKRTTNGMYAVFSNPHFPLGTHAKSLTRRLSHPSYLVRSAKNPFDRWNSIGMLTKCLFTAIKHLFASFITIPCALALSSRG